ncbi:MAG TPA: four helix bundle protein [Longimicrobiales bacterium]|nr:four helix bundle protein [Longimicrobiales bacterium]
MPQFHHERLLVYQRGIQFAAFADALINGVHGIRVDLRDQLMRASTSIPLNIAEGSGEFARAEKGRFYRIARRSATECAAILDLLRTLGVVDVSRLEPGRMLLDELVAMLTVMAMPERRKEG